MSEVCLSNRTPHISTLLLSDLFLFVSFILSHPLYFSYFIFFSPYLLKLLSFLSLPFLTTFLLLLLLLTLRDTVSPQPSPHGSQKDEKFDEKDEFHDFEELEAYGIVFDASIFDVEDSKLKIGEDSLGILEVCGEKAVEAIREGEASKSTTPAMGDEDLEGLLKDLDEFEKLTPNSGGKKKVEPESLDTKPDKVEDDKEATLIMEESDETDIVVKVRTDSSGEYTSKITTNSQLMALGTTNLGSYGSMRREKEWKRTLACKLFEERHNVEGSEEGMDMLWETYELDSSKAKPIGIINKSKSKSKKKNQCDYFDDVAEYEDEDEGREGQ